MLIILNQCINKYYFYVSGVHKIGHARAGLT